MLTAADRARVLEHLEQLRDLDLDRGQYPQGVMASRVFEALTLAKALDPTATAEDVRCCLDELAAPGVGRATWRDQARPSGWGMPPRWARYFHATGGRR